MLHYALLYSSATGPLHRFVIVAQHITDNVIAPAVLNLHTAVRISD
jgi:hypothetical protein